MPNSYPGRGVGLRHVPLACLVLLALVLFAIVALPPRSRAIREHDQTSHTKGKRTRAQFVPGEVLVRYMSEGAAKRQPRSTVLKNSLGRELAVQVERFQGSEIVAGLRIARVAPEDTMAVIEALKKQPDVLYAEPNHVWHLDVTPNDPSFGSLYGLTKIGAPQAWDTTTGSAGIVVGVVDEGIDLNHQDLQANVWTNPVPGGGSIPGITGDVNGYNFVNNTGTIPGEDHATHVAGIAGAVGNNGTGVAGVNWNVRLMSLRALDPSGGSVSDIIRAYNYAKQMRDLWVSSGGVSGANISVLNNSYGGGGFSQAAFDAISALNQSGILFVASAGNDTQNSDAVPHYPSGYDLPNVISVASTTSSDALAGTSNFGAQTVTLGAPGAAILSTTPGNTYSTFSGTSMASPHVAGSAALISARAQSTNPTLAVQQLKALLIFNGDAIPSLSGKTLTERRLNVSKSLQALAENDSAAPGTVTNFHVSSQSGRTINLEWTASGDDGASGQASLYQLSFTDEVTGSVIPLKSVLPAASGSVQTLDVKLPYRHTAGTVTLREFDNVGKEGAAAALNVSVPLSDADPYTTSLSSPVALSTGGTLLPELNFDDRYKENHPLPFAFPFFGQSFNFVTISTNGNLYFSPPPRRANLDADDVPGSTVDLVKFKMIAGLWDDLYLGTDQRADAGVFAVQPDANRIIYRWQGVPCNSGPSGACDFGGAPINFEVELRSDGTIKTRYGSGNTNLLPVVGISGGEPDAYVIDSHTSEQISKSLTNAQEVTFLPRAPGPPPTPTPTPPFSVSGSVADGGDNGVSNVAVRLELDYQGTTSTRTILTDSLGDYASGDLGCPNRVTVTPSKNGTLFSPPSLTFVSTGCLGGKGTGNFAAAPGTNPLENAYFFVNQHYRDFLGREPDSAGLGYWSNEITRCGNDPLCIKTRRVGISAAFFVELEFQRTGSYVYRLYQGGLARRPSFQEFNSDRAQIVEGPTLEADKQALALAFVQRTEFVQKYLGQTTAESFVNALILSILDESEVDLGPQRDALIAKYNMGANTNQSRAFALREAIDNAAFISAEYNKAFVLMQYFGYLQRDPDPGGYAFWLGIVNNPSLSNYYSMVCAFITSAEYQQRFSPLVPRNDTECGGV